MDSENKLRTYSISESARKLNLSRNTFLKLIRNDKIRSFLVENRRRVTEQELHRFIDQQKYYSEEIKVYSISEIKTKNQKSNSKYFKNIVNEIIGGYNGISSTKGK